MVTPADTWVQGLALLASLGCGLNGGFFFAAAFVASACFAIGLMPELTATRCSSHRA
jgi:hypothetical protein